MPPKPKPKQKKAPPTPEELKEMHEKWKQTPEWELVNELYDLVEEYDIVGQQKDLDNDLKILVEPYLVSLLKVPAVFKIKKCKIKAFNQTHLRIAYFCGRSERKEQFKIDGKAYKFTENHVNVDSFSITQDWMSITRFFVKLRDDNHLDYLQTREEIVRLFPKLAKSINDFTRKNKGFNIGIDMMNEMLDPLKQLMMCNMGITVVDFEYCSEIDFEINNFRYKALITNFCETYMKVQTIMYNNKIVDSKEVVKKELEGNPDIYSVLKKFQYLHWRLNRVESHFIQPLLNSFLKLRANLTKLYLTGFSTPRSPRLLESPLPHQRRADQRHEHNDCRREEDRSDSGQQTQTRTAELPVRPDQHHLHLSRPQEALREGKEETENDQPVDSTARHPQVSGADARSLLDEAQRDHRSSAIQAK